MTDPRAMHVRGSKRYSALRSCEVIDAQPTARYAHGEAHIVQRSVITRVTISAEVLR
jgi:hypothetical protein